jgi:hypothetical protein
MNKFTLRLADGRWVSSPTNTATSNANHAGVFTAADDESAAELRGAMERLHGPLELVVWQSKRADTPARHGENVALMDEAQDPFAGAEVIYAYTRKDALADGVQIDVSEVAREAGLKFPVYITRAAWEGYVTVPDGVRCQDEKGRLAATISSPSAAILPDDPVLPAKSSSRSSSTSRRICAGPEMWVWQARRTCVSKPSRCARSCSAALRAVQCSLPWRTTTRQVEQRAMPP